MNKQLECEFNTGNGTEIIKCKSYNVENGMVRLYDHEWKQTDDTLIIVIPHRWVYTIQVIKK